jgi:hypothetical protein
VHLTCCLTIIKKLAWPQMFVLLPVNNKKKIWQYHRLCLQVIQLLHFHTLQYSTYKNCYTISVHQTCIYHGYLLKNLLLCLQGVSSGRKFNNQSPYALLDIIVTSIWSLWHLMIYHVALQKKYTPLFRWTPCNVEKS